MLPFPSIKNDRLARLLLGALTILLLFVSKPAEAHNGPPFPIMVDKRVGPCVISVWADPNIGPSRFFVIVDAPPGGTIPSDLTVQLGLQPANGRLPEVVYKMERDNLRGQVQFKTALSFDRREFWHVRVALLSAPGSGDATVDVEATPVGLGRWDMLLYLSPFLMVGFLWLMAIVRKRSRRKTASGNLADGAGSASEDGLQVGDTQA